MKITGWHFIGNDGCLGYGDYRKVVSGETLSVHHHDTHENPHPIELCRWGMHASERLIDAMWYDKGTLLSRVVVDGVVDWDDKKFVGVARQVLWQVDMKDYFMDVLDYAKWLTRAPIRNQEHHSALGWTEQLKKDPFRKSLGEKICYYTTEAIESYFLKSAFEQRRFLYRKTNARLERLALCSPNKF